MIELLKALNQKPIAYYPIYRKIVGSTTGGILLSQLMYWFSKKEKIFKTDKEIMSETLLTEKELKNAKKLIKELDFISVTREGIPAKTYYEIDWEKFQTCLDQSDNTDGTNGPNCSGPKGKPIIVKSLTENTTENTTENKNNNKKDFSFSIKKQTQYENLSVEYKDKLKGYAVVKDGGYCLESFLNHHISKGTTFKDWSRAYNTWISNTNKFQKIDTTLYSKTIPHPKLGELYVEYGTRKAWSKDFEFVAEFNEVVQPMNEVVEEQQTYDNNQVSSILGNLADQHRV